MSNKLGLRKRRELLQKALGADANDSWATVELYRWQHGELPPQDVAKCKELSVPAGLRKMAEAFAGPNTGWATPHNVASVLFYAAKLIEKGKNQ